MIYKLTYTDRDGNAAELGGALLDEFAIQGLEENLDESISFFLPASVLGAFKTAAANIGLSLVGEESLEETNWVQQCRDVLVPLQLDKVKIVPVISAEEASAEPSNNIYIIPGLGFGTGHHPTTYMAVKLIEEFSELSDFTPKTIADVGCGSGILSIAAAKLFPAARISSYEIDPLAVENAIENCAINNCSKRITILPRTVQEGIDGPFELVIANIYAEVLIEMRDVLAGIMTPSAKLILTGITADKEAGVISAYGAGKIEKKISKDGWSAVVVAHNQGLARA